MNRRWLKRIWWHDSKVVRPIRWLLSRFALGNVPLSSDQIQFWHHAMKHAPVAFRWFGRSLRLEDVNAELYAHSDWQAVKPTIQSGDRIWPFIINSDTLAMRRGYVIVRDGRPVGGVVTVVS